MFEYGAFNAENGLYDFNAEKTFYGIITEIHKGGFCANVAEKADENLRHAFRGAEQAVTASYCPEEQENIFRDYRVIGDNNGGALTYGSSAPPLPAQCNSAEAQAYALTRRFQEAALGSYKFPEAVDKLMMAPVLSPGPETTAVQKSEALSAFLCTLYKRERGNVPAGRVSCFTALYGKLQSYNTPTPPMYSDRAAAGISRLPQENLCAADDIIGRAGITEDEGRYDAIKALLIGGAYAEHCAALLYRAAQCKPVIRRDGDIYDIAAEQVRQRIPSGQVYASYAAALKNGEKRSGNDGWQRYQHKRARVTGESCGFAYR